MSAIQSKSEVLQRIRALGIIAVLRAETEEEALGLTAAVAAGGVIVIEVTMTVPGALRLIAKLTKEQPDLLVGAGTVLDPETARICMLEGAQFIVSPALNVKTVEMCHRHSVAALPGALTPTEVVTAWQAGADAVKIFPVDAMGGAKYLKSLKAPLPQVEMIPTGGVSLASAREFLDSGAFALGVGADLIDRRLLAADQTRHITANARKYLDLIEDFNRSSAFPTTEERSRFTKSGSN